MCKSHKFLSVRSLKSLGNRKILVGAECGGNQSKMGGMCLAKNSFMEVIYEIILSRSMRGILQILIHLTP